MKYKVVYDCIIYIYNIMYVYMYVCVCVCVCVCIYIYIYIYIFSLYSTQQVCLTWKLCKDMFFV